jgi:hypothetical protein
MEAHAGRYDFHRHSVRLCRFGIDAAALGAAGSVFQRFLYSVERDPNADEAATLAPRRRESAGTAG